MTTVLVVLVAALFGGTACLERPLCTDDCRPRTTNVYVDTVDQRGVNKIDLLFMIDNSASMADKQVVLSQAVPDLVNRLVSPSCVSPGQAPQAAAADGSCATGSAHEFEPVQDIHIGVITSSLGDHGGTACPTTGSGPSAEENDDHGHLLGKRPRGQAFLAANPGGFLDWNPKTNPSRTVNDLSETFTQMTTAAGENGCGYEAQLESIYRFLADPSPPASVLAGSCKNGACAVVQGLDTELLSERAAFLRPDSLVAVILLSDENDCSIRDGGQYSYVTTAGSGSMPRGSAACVTNPNDPCCYPCGGTVPAGCTADPNCSQGVSEAQDDANLRCFHEKQRFGFDFLYPVERYVNALTQPRLCTSRVDLAPDPSQCADANKDGAPDLVPNPLYEGGRSADSVFFAGIVGVPWQDLQATADRTTSPPIAYTNAQLETELHYKTAADLADDKVWDTILGNPNPGSGAAPIAPTDGLMVESTEVRSGTDGQGHPIQGPNAGYMASIVNGHDWLISKQDDLEYACIFKLPFNPVTNTDTRQCEAGGACDCDPKEHGPDDHDPLCQDQATGAYGTTQYFAKAYPGVRELQVLRGFGKNAIVASICARNVDFAHKDTAQDYGYRPAIDALVERLKEQLVGKCLPRALTRDPATHEYPCSIIEARQVTGATCDRERGRLPPNPNVIEAARAKLHDAGYCDGDGQMKCAELSLCALQEAGEECHHDQATQPKPGWCYVDPAAGDDRSLVSHCDSTRRQTIRFVDPEQGQTPAPGARVVIACMGADLGAAGNATVAD